MTDIVYKYRSLENWKYLIDIIANSRLYAAPFQSLNDPMEGRYYYYEDDISREYRRLIRSGKEDWKICSLTKNPRSTLMWTYYGGAHAGVALGVEVPTRKNQRTRDVYYDDSLHLSAHVQQRPPQDVALEILAQKQQGWEHEQEVRVFSRNNYVGVRLKRILLGCRISTTDADLVKVLARKCHPRIPISRLSEGELDRPPPRTQ